MEPSVAAPDSQACPPGIDRIVPQASTTPKAADPFAVKPAIIEKTQRGFLVAHHVGNNDVTVTVESMRQAVHIERCKECIIKIHGKAAAINVDRCERVRFEFDSLISSFEMLNSSQIDLRPRAVLPSLRVERSENIVVYLNPESLSCKLIHHMAYPIVMMIPEPSGETESELCFRPVTVQTMFESVWNPGTGKIDTVTSTYC